MSFWLTLAGMVAVTFGSRYAGLARRAELPDFWVRFLHFVPIAVFASLVTPYLEGGRGEWRDPGRGGAPWPLSPPGARASCGSRSRSGWPCSGSCASRSDAQLWLAPVAAAAGLGRALAWSRGCGW